MINQNKTVINRAKTSTNQPFFSIIIATFNRAHLLERALKSLISQTEEDWEVIIIDDGSTDDTQLQILSYLKMHPKLTYFKKVHSGEALSKNEGLRLANGKFISFLDSDDEYAPTHLESRKQILLENPHIKLLHGGCKIIGNQYVPDRFDTSQKIHLNECIIGGTFFIEKNVFTLLKGYNKIYLGTDADLYDRAKAAEIEILETTIPTYIYHHDTQDSITNKLSLSL